MDKDGSNMSQKTRKIVTAVVATILALLLIVPTVMAILAGM